MLTSSFYRAGILAPCQRAKMAQQHWLSLSSTFCGILHCESPSRKLLRLHQIKYFEYLFGCQTNSHPSNQTTTTTTAPITTRRTISRVLLLTEEADKIKQTIMSGIKNDANQEIDETLREPLLEVQPGKNQTDVCLLQLVMEVYCSQYVISRNDVPQWRQPNENYRFAPFSVTHRAFNY